MKEISLNILDIAKNSVRADAKQIRIELEETENLLTVVIADDGCGMDKTLLAQVTDPFCTTRTTRAVGLGIPLYQLAAEQTGGFVSIESVSQKDDPLRHGTTVTAQFHTDHLDCMPLGDLISTVCTLIQGAPTTDLSFYHKKNGKAVELDTRKIREVLGEDIPIDSFEVLAWIRQSLEEEYMALEQ